MKTRKNHLSIIKKAVLPVVSSCLVPLLSSCYNSPFKPEIPKTGDLEIYAIIANNALAKSSNSLQTICDSLIVEISGPDFKTIRSAKKVDYSRPVVCDTLPQVPVGSNRTVKIWTSDKEGNVIHNDSLKTRTVTINPGIPALLNVKLVPAAGSIYLQFANIPTNVDSVFVSFVSADSTKSRTIHKKRATKLYFSFDNIPHLTSGTLMAAAVNTNGDTVYTASRKLTFDALNPSSIDLSFQSVPGGLQLSLSVEKPASTLVNISMDNSEIAESGKLVITEIMYASDDSEYIEIYNPDTVEFTGDTLVLNLDGTDRKLINVKIRPGSFFVAGRKVLPWVDFAFSVSSALDLSSGGNWITLKESNGTVIDRVIFTGGTNTIEWPVISGKKSIALDKTTLNVNDNNYGRNWTASQTLIEGSSSQYGSPHSF